MTRLFGACSISGRGTNACEVGPSDGPHKDNCDAMARAGGVDGAVWRGGGGGVEQRERGRGGQAGDAVGNRGVGGGEDVLLLRGEPATHSGGDGERPGVPPVSIAAGL